MLTCVRGDEERFVSGHLKRLEPVVQPTFPNVGRVRGSVFCMWALEIHGANSATDLSLDLV